MVVYQSKWSIHQHFLNDEFVYQRIRVTDVIILCGASKMLQISVKD